MSATPSRSTGLHVGLVVVALVAVVVFGWVSRSTPHTSQPQTTSPVAMSTVLSDPITQQYLLKLARTSPETAQKLRLETEAALQNGVNQETVAKLVVQVALSEFKPNAPYMLRASTSDYDAILDHLRTGFQTLSDAESPWCEATAVEGLLKRASPDLIYTLVNEFEYGSAAYDWALIWSGLYLDAAYNGQRLPFFHGQRSVRDKLVLQEQGLALGSKEWALALQIAAFSQAEGQGYSPMREVIGNIDVCKLVIALADLSDQLPEPTRGRIWSELMPEIFYGNTPYAMAVVTDYFFLN